MIRRVLLAAALAALAGGACKNDPQLSGSGTRASVTRTVPAFSALKVDTSADVTVQVGGAPSVTIEADDNLLANITTVVAGDVLTISSDKPFSTSSRVKVSVSAPALDAIEAMGSGSMDAAGIKAQSFRFTLGGSGNATVKGAAERLTVELSGSGNVHLFDLIAKQSEATIAGSGNVEVHASESLKATISGSGNVDYKGNPPHVDRAVGGSGAVRAR